VTPTSLVTPETLVTPTSPPSDTHVTTTSDIAMSPNTPVNRQRTTTRDSRPKAMYSAEYESFWANYPKGRGSKKDTYALWTKLNPDAALIEEIMRGLEGWHRSERWAVKNMVMESERWIRGRYWENPPPEAVRHPSQLGIPA
jgi:hypothetical protein